MDYFLDFFFFQISELVQPSRVVSFLNQFGQHRKGFLTISPNRIMCFHILVDFSWINVQVNNLRLLCVFVQSAGYTVVETHTDSNQYITFIGHHIGSIISVHPQHAHVQWVVCFQSAQPHYCCCRWNTGFFDKGLELLFCLTQDNALSKQNEWFFCRIDSLCCLFHIFLTNDWSRSVTAYMLA